MARKKSSSSLGEKGDEDVPSTTPIEDIPGDVERLREVYYPYRFVLQKSHNIFTCKFSLAFSHSAFLHPTSPTTLQKFRSGETKSVAWRKAQLLRLKKMLQEGRSKLVDALWKDLHKDNNSAWLTELVMVCNETQGMIDHFEVR